MTSPKASVPPPSYEDAIAGNGNGHDHFDGKAINISNEVPSASTPIDETFMKWKNIRRSPVHATPTALDDWYLSMYPPLESILLRKSAAPLPSPSRAESLAPFTPKITSLSITPSLLDMKTMNELWSVASCDHELVVEEMTSVITWTMRAQSLIAIHILILLCQSSITPVLTISIVITMIHIDVYGACCHNR
jgi:hypothetical protein